MYSPTVALVCPGYLHLFICSSLSCASSLAAILTLSSGRPVAPWGTLGFTPISGCLRLFYSQLSLWLGTNSALTFSSPEPSFVPRLCPFCSSSQFSGGVILQLTVHWSLDHPGGRIILPARLPQRLLIRLLQLRHLQPVLSPPWLLRQRRQFLPTNWAAVWPFLVHFQSSYLLLWLIPTHIHWLDCFYLHWVPCFSRVTTGCSSASFVSPLCSQLLLLTSFCTLLDVSFRNWFSFLSAPGISWSGFLEMTSASLILLVPLLLFPLQWFQLTDLVIFNFFQSQCAHPSSIICTLPFQFPVLYPFQALPETCLLFLGLLFLPWRHKPVFSTLPLLPLHG